MLGDIHGTAAVQACHSGLHLHSRFNVSVRIRQKVSTAVTFSLLITEVLHDFYVTFLEEFVAPFSSLVMRTGKNVVPWYTAVFSQVCTVRTEIAGIPAYIHNHRIFLNILY